MSEPCQAIKAADAFNAEMIRITGESSSVEMRAIYAAFNAVSNIEEDEWANYCTSSRETSTSQRTGNGTPRIADSRRPPSMSSH